MIFARLHSLQIEVIRNIVHIKQKAMSTHNAHTMTQVSVTLHQENTFTSEVVAGPHLITSDEPEEAGGLDKGLSPYQLVSAALGSCTAMTLHMYARHKKWPLEYVRVTLDHGKKHVDDCLECDNPNARLDHFNIRLELGGALTEEQKKRLLEIAYKCPVHKTLTSPVRIQVELAE